MCWYGMSVSQCAGRSHGVVGVSWGLSVQVEIPCGPDVYEEYHGVPVCRWEYHIAPMYR